MKTPTKTLQAMKKTLINHTSFKPTPTSSKPSAAQAGMSTSDSLDVIHGTKLNSGNLKKPDKAGVFTFARLDQLQVVPGFNPRSEPGDVSHLAESIKAEGVLTSLVVRPARVSGKFDIIAGERRYLACQQAAYDRPVPVLIRSDLVGDDERALAVALAENSEDGRTNLNMIEIGRAAKKLEKKGWPNTRIAKETGTHAEKIRRALKLIESPDDVQKEVKSGNWSPAAGLEYARLDENTKKAVRDRIGKTTTAQDIREFRKKHDVEKFHAGIVNGKPPMSVTTRGTPRKSRPVTTWRGCREKHELLRELCAKFDAFTAEHCGTPEYHEIRGMIGWMLYDRGDRDTKFLPDLQPSKDDKDYAAQMKDLAGFNAVVKAEAAKFEAAKLAEQSDAL